MSVILQMFFFLPQHTFAINVFGLLVHDSVWTLKWNHLVLDL